MILLQLHENLSKNSMSITVWLFSIWSKLERWKSLISVCLMGWFQMKTNHHFGVLASLFMCNDNKPLRESIPRQIDKKSRVPKEVIGVWDSWSGDRSLEFSRRRERQTFLSLFHSLSHFKLCSRDYTTTMFKLCSRDYTATMYPARGQFLLSD